MQVKCAIHKEMTPQLSLLQMILESEKAWIVSKDYTPADCQQKSKMISLNDQRLFTSAPYTSCRDYTDTKGQTPGGKSGKWVSKRNINSSRIHGNIRFMVIFPLALVRLCKLVDHKCRLINCYDRLAFCSNPSWFKQTGRVLNRMRHISCYLMTTMSIYRVKTYEEQIKTQQLY